MQFSSIISIVALQVDVYSQTRDVSITLMYRKSFAEIQICVLVHDLLTIYIYIYICL